MSDRLNELTAENDALRVRIKGLDEALALALDVSDQRGLERDTYKDRLNVALNALVAIERQAEMWRTNDRRASEGLPRLVDAR